MAGKFRKIATAAPIDLEVVSDLTPYVDEVYPLYLQVHERSPLKFETLTKEYLSELGRRMFDRARFFIWRQHGKAIAFSVALVHDGTIYVTGSYSRIWALDVPCVVLESSRNGTAGTSM